MIIIIIIIIIIITILLLSKSYKITKPCKIYEIVAYQICSEWQLQHLPIKKFFDLARVN